MEIEVHSSHGPFGIPGMAVRLFRNSSNLGRSFVCMLAWAEETIACDTYDGARCAHSSGVHLDESIACSVKVLSHGLASHRRVMFLPGTRSPG
jgi:hypothetical protein